MFLFVFFCFFARGFRLFWFGVQCFVFACLFLAWFMFVHFVLGFVLGFLFGMMIICFVFYVFCFGLFLSRAVYVLSVFSVFLFLFLLICFGVFCLFGF